MPGQQLQTTAFILSRQPSGADSFEQLLAFSEEHGVLHCLTRMPKPGGVKSAGRNAPAPGTGRLDLFDETELWLESSNQGRTWFIKEHRVVRRHDGIGGSYEALRAAAALGALVSRHAVPEESRESITGILRATFAALAGGGRPDVAWLKALYCFLRDEGYPVKQQWWPALPESDRAEAARLLNQPLAGQSAEAATVARVTRGLEDWVRAETEIRL